MPALSAQLLARHARVLPDVCSPIGQARRNYEMEASRGRAPGVSIPERVALPVSLTKGKRGAAMRSDVRDGNGTLLVKESRCGEKYQV